MKPTFGFLNKQCVSPDGCQEFALKGWLSWLPGINGEIVPFYDYRTGKKYYYQEVLITAV
jgi:hypothetical protein